MALARDQRGAAFGGWAPASHRNAGVTRPPKIPPSTPRRICRPTWLPIVRAVCLAMVSIMPWRRLVPNSASLTASPKPPPWSCCAAPAPRRACRRRRRAHPRPRGARPVFRRGFAVDGLVVLRADRTAGAHLRALGIGDRAHAAARRRDQRLLHRHRHALVEQHRHQRLAHAEWPMACATSSFGFATKVSAAVFTAFWSRGVKARSSVLHAVAELAEHVVGHVVGELRAEVHAHALGTDQAHDLLDALLQRRRRVVEQQVRLVEHEHQLRLVEVADLGQGSNSSDSSHSRKLEYSRGFPGSAGRRRGSRSCRARPGWCA